jgi:hypothetical protein
MKCEIYVGYECAAYGKEQEERGAEVYIECVKHGKGQQKEEYEKKENKQDNKE